MLKVDWGKKFRQDQKFCDVKRSISVDFSRKAEINFHVLGNQASRCWGKLPKKGVEFGKAGVQEGCKR